MYSRLLPGNYNAGTAAGVHVHVYCTAAVVHVHVYCTAAGVLYMYIVQLHICIMYMYMYCTVVSSLLVGVKTKGED